MDVDDDDDDIRPGLMKLSELLQNDNVITSLKDITLYKIEIAVLQQNSFGFLFL